MNDKEINNVIARYWCNNYLNDMVGAKIELSLEDINSSNRVHGGQYDSDFGWLEITPKKSGLPKVVHA